MTDKFIARTGLLIVVSGLILLLVAATHRSADSIADTASFRKMTSAAHLAEGKSELGTRVFGLALAHLEAIPANAPESVEALKGIKYVRSEMEAEYLLKMEVQRQREAQHEAQNDIRAMPTIVAQNLQAEIRNLGYSVDVSVSKDKPGELVITSSDFSDTDHRVRFLALLRRRSDLQGMFQTVRLKAGFLDLSSDAYSL
jgi:hypothetical protein